MVEETLRSFYGLLKGCDENLRLVYITGLINITKTAIFYNLNNILNISFKLSAGTLFGYTEAEILQYFTHFMELYQRKHNISDTTVLMSLLKENINCYRFGVDGTNLSEVVFNPYAVNKVFDGLSLKPYWYDSVNVKLVVQKFQSIDKIMSLVEGIDVRLIDVWKPEDLTNINVYHLLYYTGYMTIKSCESDDVIHLGCPNKQMAAMLLIDLQLCTVSCVMSKS